MSDKTLKLVGRGDVDFEELADVFDVCVAEQLNKTIDIGNQLLIHTIIKYRARGTGVYALSVQEELKRRFGVSRVREIKQSDFYAVLTYLIDLRRKPN